MWALSCVLSMQGRGTFTQRRMIGASPTLRGRFLRSALLLTKPRFRISLGDMNDPVLCFMIIGNQITVHELKVSSEIEAEIKDYLEKTGSPDGIASRQRLAGG